MVGGPHLILPGAVATGVAEEPNTINCRVDLGPGQGCGVGIELGATRWPAGGPWTDFMAYGDVHDNHVWNAAIGLLANHSISSSVHNNDVHYSGGGDPGPYSCGGDANGRRLPACAYSGISVANHVGIWANSCEPNCSCVQRDDVARNCFIAGYPF